MPSRTKSLSLWIKKFREKNNMLVAAREDISSGRMQIAALLCLVHISTNQRIVSQIGDPQVSTANPTPRHPGCRKQDLGNEGFDDEGDI
jgi:hypothetical protein